MLLIKQKLGKVYRRNLALSGCIVGLLLVLDALYLPAKALLAQQLLTRAWENSQLSGMASRPWPWADTHALAKLSFPRLNGHHIVLAGSSGRTLAFAPGHLTGTALPGESGHIIISAHRDSHFSILEKLQMGDRITLQALNGEVTTYKINQIRVIDSRYEKLMFTPNIHRLTLITCYPFDAAEAGGPLRLQIDASPILTDG